MDTLAGQTMSSSHFRKQYASLTVPTIVTVNGHIIGTWVPGSDARVRTAQVGDDFVQNRQTTEVSAQRITQGRYVRSHAVAAASVPPQLPEPH